MNLTQLLECGESVFLSVDLGVVIPFLRCLDLGHLSSPGLSNSHVRLNLSRVPVPFALNKCLDLPGHTVFTRK